MRRLFKILRRLLGGVLLLGVLLYFALQHPVVQSWLAARAAAWLGSELGTTVRVGGVDIDLWARAVLEDVYVEDLHHDTLAYISAVHIGRHNLDREGKTVFIRSILLEEPVINLVRYKGEQGMNFSFISQYFSDTTANSSVTYTVTFDELKIRNGTFRYNNLGREPREHHGIDWNRLAVSGLDLELENFSSIDDSIHAEILALRASERSGFMLQSFTGKIDALPGKVNLGMVKIETPESKINGDLSFNFENAEDWNDFENKVKMDNHFENSKLCACDLAYFAPKFSGLEKTIEISGDVKGKISKLKGKNIILNWDNNSFFRGDFTMDGLPKIDQTFIELDVIELSSNKFEIEKIPLPPFNTEPKRYINTPANFAQLGQISFAGNFTGFINDFVAYGTLHTAIGEIESDIALREKTEDGDYVYTGNLKPRNFDFGKFYGKREFGLLTADLGVVGNGLRIQSVDADIKGVIEELQFKGYSYRNAQVQGNYKSRSFNGDLRINDENASLDFYGEVNFKGKEPVFDFDADIYNLDLKKLNLYPDVNYSGISGHISVDSCIGLSPQTFRGEILFRDFTYCTRNRDYYVGTASLSSRFSGERRTIELMSPFGRGRLEGKFDFRAMEKSFSDVLASVIPSFESPANNFPPQDFTLTLEDLDLRQVTEIFYPEISIAPHTRLNIAMNEAEDSLRISLDCDSAIFYGRHLHGLTLDVSRPRPDKNYSITLLTDKLWIDDLEIPDLAIDNMVFGDSIRTEVIWGDETSLHGGELSGNFNIRGNRNFDFRFGPSAVRLNNRIWNFAENAMIMVDSTQFRMQNISVSNGNQVISLDGVIAETSRPKLDILVNAFDLENLNFLTRRRNVVLSGVVSGVASMRDFYGDRIFTSDITLLNFILNEYDIGDLCLASTWDHNRRELALEGELERNKITPLTFDGVYRPDNKTSPLDLVAHAKNFDLAFLNGFMAEGMIELNGLVTGDVAVTGTPQSPMLKGRAMPHDVSLYVNYLNTRYYVLEEVGLEPDMFTFDYLRCSDQEGHLGYLTGTIAHNNFRDWNFDMIIEIEEEKFLCMDTQMEESSLYYGKAYGTGYVNIFGYARNLEFDINLKSESGSTLGLPLGNSAEVEFGEFVRFVDNDNPPVEEQPVDLTGIKLNFDLEITPDVDFEIVFDRAVGDVMRGHGQGHLNMDINQFGEFSMYGLIEVLEGNYLFTLKNLVNKEFKDATGTLAWYGNPYEADIDLRTVYRVSASLYSIMPEEDERYRQRIPVDLVLYLRDKLLEPSISFDIELPTVDQLTRGRVESAISSEQEKSRQAFALLVLQRFVSPPNVTKEHSGGIGLAENSSELLSSQLSNWLSQISSDFNLGFNYRPGDEISNDEIALALSTQLFNERLQVSGNFGVSRGTSSNQNPSTLIGDLRLEYKLTPEGKIRLMVYNESNDFNIAAVQQSPYTQGIGLIYTEEFDTADQFFCQFGNLLRRKNAEQNCR